MYDPNRTGELHIKDVLDAYLRLTNKSLELSALYNYLSLSKSTDPNRTRISFEQFCALVAEFSTGGCETIETNGTFSDPLFWTSTLLKTRHMFRFYLVRPITNVLGTFTSNTYINNTWLIKIHLLFFLFCCSMLVFKSFVVLRTHFCALLFG